MQPVENELHLRVAIQNIARMYNQGDSDATEESWNEEMHEMMAEQTRCVREALEREIAIYLAQKHKLLPAKKPRKTATRPHFKTTGKSKMTINA